MREVEGPGIPYDPAGALLLVSNWPNRDSIAEQGGLNLYAMVGNDPVNKWDYLWMADLTFLYLTEIEPSRVTYLGMTFNGGIKTTQTVSVDPDDCSATFNSTSVRLTIRYESQTGPQIVQGRSDGSTLTFSIEEDPDDPCKCILEMEGNEGNPLISAPGITYSATVTFDKKDKTYDWEVEHDRYPSHRLYGHDSSALHDFSHVSAGTTPGALWPAASNETNSGNDVAY
jgi:hypothetical protein